MIEGAVRIEDRHRIEDPAEVVEVGSGAYDLLVRQLESLGTEDWQAMTVCEPWTVHDMVAHLVGAAHATASLREAIRQLSYGLRHRGEFGGSDLDAMNDLQVREHRHRSRTELIALLREVGPRAVRKRARFPRLLARIPIPLSTGGNAAPGMPERISLGELQRVIYTRDVFMHRIDIAGAVGRPVELDPDVDRRIVEDVVIEWCRNHGRAVEVDLTGPAGGCYVFGGGGQRIELDAIEFCLALSGREEADGLLRHRVLF